MVFTRKGGDWVAEVASGTGTGTVLRMPEIGIEIPMAELYADVELTGTRKRDGEADGS